MTIRTVLAGTLASLFLLAGCTSTSATEAQVEATPSSAPVSAEPSAPPAPPPPPLPPASVALNLPDGATDVKVTPVLEAPVTGGELSFLSVHGPGDQKIEGTLTGTTWNPVAPLEWGTPYTVYTVARNSDGRNITTRSGFTTMNVPEENQIEAQMMPIDGETVGVGMPVVVYLTEPIAPEARAAFETRLQVNPSVPVAGDWRWFSDTEIHWRPQTYWPANTSVNVKVLLNKFDGQNGNWGVADRDITFQVGNANITTVDLDTHQMTTTINGEVARTVPVSGGREDEDPSFVTRSGVHLVLSKHADYTMDGASAGAGDYLTDVQWATRISNSGEFVHAAPWSVSSQGRRNVSHGCVNTSTENAKWFYDISQRGDVVDVIGTERRMELTNGLGDWTLTWEEWIAS